MYVLIFTALHNSILYLFCSGEGSGTMLCPCSAIGGGCFYSGFAFTEEAYIWQVYVSRNGITVESMIQYLRR